MDFDLGFDLGIDDFIAEQEMLKRINFDFYKPHPKHLEFHNLSSAVLVRFRVTDS